MIAPTVAPAPNVPSFNWQYRFTRVNKEGMQPKKKARVNSGGRKSISSNQTVKGKSSIDVGDVLTGLQPTLQEHIKKAEATQEKVVSLLGEMKESNSNISVSMARIADALAALAQGNKHV